MPVLEKRQFVSKKPAGMSIVFVQFLPLNKLKLNAPLLLKVEYSPKIVIVAQSDLDLFGYGDTESESVRDFSKTLEELYFSLKKNKNKLSKDLTTKLQILSAVVTEK